ncbi:MAG: hypothetical protein ACT6RL_18970 [Neoaquamicrobium sediminum]|uniref:hypothetical protein n=1 Tax=Neoaquamicrobium sediminum TaxID=1849104 RepID=UPI004036B2E9
MSADARAAAVQLRALLLADAAIDIGHARRLIEAAAERLADPAAAQELVETFLCLIQINAVDFGNMHDVKDPIGEALSLLSASEAGTSWRRQ